MQSARWLLPKLFPCQVQPEVHKAMVIYLATNRQSLASIPTPSVTVSNAPCIYRRGHSFHGCCNPTRSC